MMRTFGSDGGFQADNRGGIIDQLGNTILSADTSFAASPLGIAARTQALYGIPNANFNLVPPSPSSPIVANANDLPYWSIENLSDEQITATSVFDATTQTWGVEINPGTAAGTASLTLSTRSYLITDDNLALRQKALSVLSKSGSAGGTASQWNLSLSAIYYDPTGAALSTAIIGTVYDTGTWTSLSGFTTPGGSAINAAAQYVDLTFTFATTTAVTGSAKATIKSLVLATSAAASGNFVVTEVFTANGTWTRPVGVDYVTVLGIGGGGGGAGGAGIISFNVPNQTGMGGAGGARAAVIYDVPVTAGSYSIGIGSGGNGGVGGTASKASGAGTADVTLAAVTGSAGGATTFGSLLTFPGGNQSSGTAGGGVAGGITTSVWTPTDASTSAAGGNGTGVGAGGTPSAANNGGAGITNTYLPLYTVAGVAGAAGSTGSTTGTAGTAVIGSAGVAGSAGWVGGGGGGSGATGSLAGTAGNGGGGAGAAGGNAIRRHTASTTMTATGGAGGAAAANSGAGGGPGGLAITTVTDSTAYNTSTLTVTGGNGGAGGSGLLVVSYVA